MFDGGLGRGDSQLRDDLRIGIVRALNARSE